MLLTRFVVLMLRQVGKKTLGESTCGSPVETGQEKDARCLLRLVVLLYRYAGKKTLNDSTCGSFVEIGWEDYSQQTGSKQTVGDYAAYVLIDSDTAIDGHY